MVFVRVSGNNVLVIRKRLLRQLLGQAVGFFGGNIILRVKAVLEVIILPAVKPLRLVKKLRCFGELPCIVAVVVKCVGSNDFSLLFILEDAADPTDGMKKAHSFIDDRYSLNNSDLSESIKKYIWFTINSNERYAAISERYRLLESKRREF